MSHPLVSIITATRNRKSSLERLIKTVINQTYPNIEHVVVDGLSSDGTQELLQNYKSKYNLQWISEKDKNQVEALNKGLKMAQGEFVTVTHDDDYWLEDGISKLMKVLTKNPSLDLVYGDSWGEYPDGRREQRNYKYYTFSDLVNSGYQIPQDGAIFKSKWLERIGYLDENIEYVPEYDLFLRIIQKGGKYTHIPEITSIGGLHTKKKSWVGAKTAWIETRRVNRAHGGKLFSKFTLLYLKNRYLEAPTRVLRHLFPFLPKIMRKILHLPTYD